MYFHGGHKKVILFNFWNASKAESKLMDIFYIIFKYFFFFKVFVLTCFILFVLLVLYEVLKLLRHEFLLAEFNNKNIKGFKEAPR
jgi:hypothetical protein